MLFTETQIEKMASKGSGKPLGGRDTALPDGHRDSIEVADAQPFEKVGQLPFDLVILYGCFVEANADSFSERG